MEKNPNKVSFIKKEQQEFILKFVKRFYIKLRYCQLVSHSNRIKRFFYGLAAKTFDDRFENCIFVDECTIELRKETFKKWRKNLPFQTVNSSVGKPPHNPKIHVWAGISRSGPTQIIIFKGNLKGPGYVRILQRGIFSFLEKFPYGHILMMDNAPSHTCTLTKSFMSLNSINPSLAQSPVRNHAKTMQFNI